MEQTTVSGCKAQAEFFFGTVETDQNMSRLLWHVASATVASEKDQNMKNTVLAPVFLYDGIKEKTTA